MLSLWGRHRWPFHHTSVTQGWFKSVLYKTKHIHQACPYKTPLGKQPLVLPFGGLNCGPSRRLMLNWGSCPVRETGDSDHLLSRKVNVKHDNSLSSLGTLDNKVSEWAMNKGYMELTLRWLYQDWTISESRAVYSTFSKIQGECCCDKQRVYKLETEWPWLTDHSAVFLSAEYSWQWNRTS